MAGSKSCRTSIGRHSGRLPRAEVRSNDLYSNRASGGETGGKDMRARSVVARRVSFSRSPSHLQAEGRSGQGGLHLLLFYSKHYTRDRFLSPLDDDR